MSAAAAASAATTARLRPLVTERGSAGFFSAAAQRRIEILTCEDCGRRIHLPRPRCVHCGSTDRISFRQFAGTSYLRAECCEACKGYSKVFYLESARALEPLADDLGSLGLDVLVGEEGFSRVPNPFVLGVMAGGEENN